MALPGPAVFERAGLAAWPGIETEWDGNWVRRAANGYTKRANSVQSLDPGDQVDATARIAGAAQWFRTRGLRPTFRVTPLVGSQVVAALDDWGWSSMDDSHLFAMALVPTDPHKGGRLYDFLDPAFLAVQQQLYGYSEEQMDGLKGVLGMVKMPGIGVILSAPGGEAVASALMTIADGIVFTGNIITASSHRGKGYGTAMMRTGLAWACDAGANIAALNVAADNPAAQALYRRLGYRRQYDYTYYVPPR